MSLRIPTIGILGSGKNPLPEYSQPLGALVATEGFNLVTGGGGGVMLAASEAFSAVQSRTGRCLGVVPSEPDSVSGYRAKDGYPNRFVEICVLSPLPVFEGLDPNQVSRNHIIVLTADVLIALPGNKGTRNEVELATAFKKPVALFGPEGAFGEFPSGPAVFTHLDDVLRFIRAAVESKNQI